MCWNPASTIQLMSGQRLSLAAAASFEPVNLVLPKLNRLLCVAARKLESLQTGRADHELQLCDALATHILDPAAADEKSLRKKTALEEWYREHFEPYRRVFEETRSQGVTVQEGLLVSLEEVIAAFRETVFTEPYSDPPLNDRVVDAYDPSTRATLRPQRRNLINEPAVQLAGNTVPPDPRKDAVILDWEHPQESEVPHASQYDRNEAFHRFIEDALIEHAGRDVIVLFDESSAKVRGLGMLLCLHLRKLLPESYSWLTSRQVIIVSKPDNQQCRICKHPTKKEIMVSALEPFTT